MQSSNIALVQTPLTIRDDIRRLCEKVSPMHELRFLNVAPIAGAKPDNCFENVAGEVARQGGKRVCGWAVFEGPRIWIELQFHAVWSDNDGHLADVTPRNDGERVVLFLPDDLEYCGTPVPTRFFATSSSPQIKRLIELQSEINSIKSDYFLRNKGRTVMDEVSVRLVLSREAEKSSLIQAMRYVPLRNEPCPCLSRKKFKHCHGKHL